MKSKIQTLKVESARAIVGLLVIVAMLALLLVPLVRAIEITPPVNVSVQVANNGASTLPVRYRSESFLPADTFFAITNSGTGTLVTNDFGCTNLIQYKRIRPSGGTFYTTNTYVTNALVSPYYWQIDGTNAIYMQFTGKPAWLDVPTWCDAFGNVSTNLSISVAVTGASTATTNTIPLTFAKSADGMYYDTNSGAVFSTTIGPIVGTNTFATNMFPPSSFLAGARYIRLLWPVSGTNSPTTTNFFNSLSLNGYGN